jgi:ribosomal protein S18 acetylase RimI-like enzyme
MIIRSATPIDAPVIVALISELAQSGGESSPITIEFTCQYLASGGKILLAEVEQQVVGLLSYSTRLDLYHAGTTALIEELVVAEAWRGQGVGGALLDELLKRLEQEGCVEVSVTTMPDNAGAMRFYKSHGLTDEAVYLEKHFAYICLPIK